MNNIFQKGGFQGFGGVKPMKTGSAPIPQQGGAKRVPLAGQGAAQGKAVPVERPKGPAAPGKSGFSDCPICH